MQFGHDIQTQKNKNKTSYFKEIASERNKISLIRKDMTLVLFCLTIYKFDQQSYVRIINRLIECCDRRQFNVNWTNLKTNLLPILNFNYLIYLLLSLT